MRYVGVEHAERIHELNIPLEYYIETLRMVQYDKMPDNWEVNKSEKSFDNFPDDLSAFAGHGIGGTTGMDVSSGAWNYQ